MDTQNPVDPMSESLATPVVAPEVKVKKARKPAKAAVVVAAPEALAAVVAEAPMAKEDMKEPMGMATGEEKKEAVVKKVRKPVVKKAAVVAAAKPASFNKPIVVPPAKSFVTPPQPVAQPRPMMRPLTPPPVRQTTSKVETETKTAVAVGLAAAGALALAAAAALLSLRSDKIFLRLATAPTTSATAPYQPRIVSQFVISLDPKFITIPRTADMVGDGTERAIAAFDVSAKGAAWTFEKLRVQLTGSEVVKSIVVRDETGAPIMGSVTPVAGADHQYDVVFAQKIPAGVLKVYTVYASITVKGTPKVSVGLTVLATGLSARSETGELATSLRAPLVSPSWTVVQPPAKKK